MGTQTELDVAISPSKDFEKWLHGTGGSLAFSSYQAGRLFVIRPGENGATRGHELQFPRSMGIGLSDNGQKLTLATQHQIYRFDNFLDPGETRSDGTDALFVPRTSWVTGDVDAHDIGFGKNGMPIFVNTGFNCLATVSPGFSFRASWKPPFISRIVREDRCHINGLAMQDGCPRYVTLVGESDVKAGWRDLRRDGGVVMEVPSGRVVCAGLSMPHSPRLHNGKLWVLNSGEGQFGWVDPQAETFHPVATCPGYARGLDFAGKYAIIALSLARENRTFSGLGLDEFLGTGKIEPRCGLIVVNTENGQTVGSLTITGAVRELFDVQFLPGMRQPRVIGFRTPEIRQLIIIDDRPGHPAPWVSVNSS